MRPRRSLRWLAYWGPPLAWSVGLYLASAQPALPRPGEAVGISDDVVNYTTHALSYGVLAWLVWRPLARQVWAGSDLVIAFPEVTAGFYAVFYSIGDEVHQAFVPGRTASGWDVLADVLGSLAVLGILGATRLWNRRMVSKV
ncbi:MAG: VanZ family protein [Anaerolineae bacterium]